MKVIDLKSNENTSKVTIDDRQYRINEISENFAWNLLHDERFSEEQAVQTVFQTLVIMEKLLDTPKKKQLAKMRIDKVMHDMAL